MATTDRDRILVVCCLVYWIFFLINILSVLNKMSKIKNIEAIVIAKPQLLLAMVLRYYLIAESVGEQLLVQLTVIQSASGLGNHPYQRSNWTVMDDNMYKLYYRPQQSCGKVMFLHLSVSFSVHMGACIPRMPPCHACPPSACTPPLPCMPPQPYTPLCHTRSPPQDTTRCGQ